jgi:exodeoxyribonuclease VII large subunit
MMNVDVIIIGRGGGSIEDLWGFNDEALVRTVAASRIPVISAVGHETDFTLCDFAADRRAPTPSAAAEIAVPDVAAIGDYLVRVRARIDTAVGTGINKRREDVFNFEKIVLLNSPIEKLKRSRLKMENYSTRIDASIQRRLSVLKREIGELSAKLYGMNPLSVLSRGFGAIENAEGKIISSAASISVGENVKIIMSDGSVSASVSAIDIKNERIPK